MSYGPRPSEGQLHRRRGSTWSASVLDFETDSSGSSSSESDGEGDEEDRGELADQATSSKSFKAMAFPQKPGPHGSRVVRKKSIPKLGMGLAGIWKSSGTPSPSQPSTRNATPVTATDHARTPTQGTRKPSSTSSECRIVTATTSHSMGTASPRATIVKPQVHEYPSHGCETSATWSITSEKTETSYMHKDALQVNSALATSHSSSTIPNSDTETHLSEYSIFSCGTANQSSPDTTPSSSPHVVDRSPSQSKVSLGWSLSPLADVIRRGPVTDSDMKSHRVIDNHSVISNAGEHITARDPEVCSDLPSVADSKLKLFEPCHTSVQPRAENFKTVDTRSIEGQSHHYGSVRLFRPPPTGFQALDQLQNLDNIPRVPFSASQIPGLVLPSLSQPPLWETPTDPALRRALAKKHELEIKLARMPRNRQGKSHIFVDMSNIWIGFINKFKQSRGIDIEHRIRAPQFAFENFAQIMERDFDIGKRVLAGSCSSPANQRQNWPRYLHTAEGCQYLMNIFDRVQKEKTPKYKRRTRVIRNSPYEMAFSSADESTEDQYPRTIIRNSEQGVDENLHLNMMHSILDCMQEPGTMVLATGDAAEAEFSDGFKKHAIRALENGWAFELVSWKGPVSWAWRDPVFLEKYGDRFRIVELDDFLEELIDE